MIDEQIDIRQMQGLVFGELQKKADALRRQETAPRIETCAIMNAKSGACSEDCAFCAQSACHAGKAAVYPLKGAAQVREEALIARDRGAVRFSIVTSGARLTGDEVLRVCDGVLEIVKTGMRACASLGSIGKEDLALLKSAGLSRYHHNIETCESFYPRIVRTHTYASRVATIREVQAQGLEVCSGGIFGMGESLAERISMARELRGLNVDAVPVNVLVPVAGTPLAEAPALPPEEILRTLALFRMVLGTATIILAAGRDRFDARAAFACGVNGIMIGDYLTTKGIDADTDRAMIREIAEAWQTQI